MNKEKTNNNFCLILLGDPASGKATQAARLVRSYKLYDLDMGQELRASRWRKDYVKRSGRGILATTAIVRYIFLKKIPAVPLSRGILFNGTPKMIGEAKLVARLLRESGRRRVLFLYLSIPLKETMQRLNLRRRKENRPDDDQVAVLRRRAGMYRLQILPKVVPYFAARYPYRKISGLGTETQVASRISREVKKFLALTI